MTESPVPRVPSVPTDAARRLAVPFGLDPDELRVLSAFESEVVTADGPEGPTVLKVVAPEHRSRTQVQAEIDWLVALRAEGVPVAEPLRSLQGHWTELDGDPPCVGIAFRKAQGRTTGPEDWTPSRLESWGALLGRLQAHARSWTAGEAARPGWLVQSYMGVAEAVLGRDEAFMAAVVDLRTQATEMPGDPDGVGLIHADLHHRNLLLDGESWTAIDFDDSVIGPYAFDLAMPLYYAVEARVRDEGFDDPSFRAAAADAFLTPFLAGFRRHAPEPEGGATAAATSLAIRQAELAVVLRVKLDPAKWTAEQARAATVLRDGTASGREIVPYGVLERHLGS